MCATAEPSTTRQDAAAITADALMSDIVGLGLTLDGIRDWHSNLMRRLAEHEIITAEDMRNIVKVQELVQTASVKLLVARQYAAEVR